MAPTFSYDTILISAKWTHVHSNQYFVDSVMISYRERGYTRLANNAGMTRSSIIMLVKIKTEWSIVAKGHILYACLHYNYHRQNLP